MTKKILTVDDSATMRNMLMATLSAAGYDVVQAEDGVEGIKALEGQRYDLIITDINMPNMDGLTFIERLREKPEHKSVPVLVLTTENEPEKKARARRAGATGWLVKPFDPQKLVDTINRVSP